MMYSVFSDFTGFCILFCTVAQQLGRPQNFLPHLSSLDFTWVVREIYWNMKDVGFTLPYYERVEIKQLG